MKEVCIKLSEEELAKLVKAAQEGGFKKVEEFIKFLIEEAVEGVEVSEEEMKEVAERLRSLGYF